TAARNQDAIRLIALAFYFNGALARDLGIAIGKLYAGVIQHLTIDAFEAIQLFILGLRPATDIELRSHIAPSERRRFREYPAHFRRIHHQLLRNTTAQYASAPHPG